MNWLVRLQQIASILFFIYVLALLGRSAWANSQSNRELEDLKASIAELEADNRRLENLQVYLQTDAFRELEARQDLQIKRPGEAVVILPDEPEAAEIMSPSVANPIRPTTLTFLQAWWDYFFH